MNSFPENVAAKSRVNLFQVITKLELGGAQTQLLGLCANLPQNRYNINICYSPGILADDFASLKGARLRRLFFLCRPLNLLRDICALLELLILLISRRVDIVHTHSSKAGIIGRIAARMAGVPVIIHTVHGWSFNEYQPAVLRKAYILLERFCALFTDKIIAVCSQDIDKGISCGIASGSKYALVRYGIDFNLYGKYGRKYISEALGISDKDKIVGMVGCFKPQKAPGDFIEVARLISKQFPETKFVLIGDGELRSQVENSIRNACLQPNVILTGWRRDIPALLAGMEVFVLSSLWEGLPIAVLEALKSGVPVVATDTGGIKDVLRDGVNGFLLPRGDTRGMAARVAELLANESLRNDLAVAAGNSLRQEYSTEYMASKTDSLYQSELMLKKSAYAFSK